MNLKKGLKKGSCGNILKKSAKDIGWSLCVGAGISRPAFSDWGTLVRKLISRIDGDDNANKIIKLLEEFGPDALIQAACNILDLSVEEFSILISEQLYGDIKNQMEKNEWKIFSKALSVTSPAEMKKELWLETINIIEKYFKNTSAYQIAKVIAPILGEELKPNAILSFNAEPLLFTLINSFLCERFNFDPNTKKYMDFVTRSISNKNKDRLTYTFCHGFLPIPNQIQKRGLVSIDKLVFSENEYLSLANNSYSWQSSTFYNICSSQPVVFIGVSLTDPNMRRWLAWIHFNRTNELFTIKGKSISSTTHFWMRKVPDNLEEIKWIEATVAHLGVRLVWINDWSEVGETLLEMLGGT
ncbi:SIR2 family protein [Paenibacillus sp. WQ 127069]|uniref:SIR2 family protein n=1 Tax=Paenibacillus baimaensis TaxID=2982185 RepID=A0ABT2UBB4_9BACL|nr:SIR2 family protein [Paenibacillus sp. WQ 127069]MCU6791912.1 SIR2 family protein [Paenibacillus sp. WQ 127069]